MTRFAAMSFYGAIEQMLTGWIFGLLPCEGGSVRARQVAGGGDRVRGLEAPLAGDAPGDAKTTTVGNTLPR